MSRPLPRRPGPRTPPKIGYSGFVLLSGMLLVAVRVSLVELPLSPLTTAGESQLDDPIAGLALEEEEPLGEEPAGNEATEVHPAPDVLESMDMEGDDSSLDTPEEVKPPMKKKSKKVTVSDSDVQTSSPTVRVLIDEAGPKSEEPTEEATDSLPPKRHKKSKRSKAAGDGAPNQMDAGDAIRSGDAITPLPSSGLSQATKDMLAGLSKAHATIGEPTGVSSYSLSTDSTSKILIDQGASMLLRASSEVEKTPASESKDDFNSLLGSSSRDEGTGAEDSISSDSVSALQEATEDPTKPPTDDGKDAASSLKALFGDKDDFDFMSLLKKTDDLTSGLHATYSQNRSTTTSIFDHGPSNKSDDLDYFHSILSSFKLPPLPPLEPMQLPEWGGSSTVQQPLASQATSGFGESAGPSRAGNYLRGGTVGTGGSAQAAETAAKPKKVGDDGEEEEEDVEGMRWWELLTNVGTDLVVNLKRWNNKGKLSLAQVRAGKGGPPGQIETFSFRDPHNGKERELELELDFLQHLPEEDFQTRYRTCALVGNSGVILKTGFGAEIDKHEAVIRINYAPTEGFEADVGSKTTLDFCNKENTAGLMKGTHKWRDSTLVLFESHSRIIRQKVYRRLFAQFKTPAEHAVVVLNPALVTAARSMYLAIKREVEHMVRVVMGGEANTPGMEISEEDRALGRAMYEAKINSSPAGEADNTPEGFEFHAKPMSGMVAVYMAMQMCDSVDMYGFDSYTEASMTPYHYFDTRVAMTWVHSFDLALEVFTRISKKRPSVQIRRKES